MKTFTYYFKSHTAAPDIEGEIEAKSRYAAIEILNDMFDLDRKDIDAGIVEEGGEKTK
ncbi:MAG: hypothetical protein Q7S72_00155 [Candidatus Taylorbacteria bacterium]|nr:hypothetical protein [Candidatus Taylorbacteria bacterium]